MKQRLYILYIILLCISSVSAQEKIILLNEGNWQSDNAKVTYFEDGKVVSNQWFRDKNGYKIGDTPNDIVQINSDLIAISVNWSNIIQFIRPDGTAVAATEDVPNNRCLATDGKYVYVTSYGHECGTISGTKTFSKGYVAKIDAQTYKVVSATEVGYEPEGIACYAGHLFVANTGGYAFQEDHPYETTVTVLNAETMEKVRDIDTGCINLYGKMSASGKYLCVNSTGDYYDVEAATIILDCDAALHGAEKCFTVLPYAATYNTRALDGSFYAVGSRYSYNTGEYQFNCITIDPAEVMTSDGKRGITHSLPGTVQSYIEKMTSPYDLYVNPYTGYIYATDAKSYASAGDMYQWKPDGTFVGKHKVYINPAHFLALPPDGVFDGISEVHKDTNHADIFSISGVKVSIPRRGDIYIKNGKKYVQK